MEIFADGHWLPLIFALLMGIAMLVYATLDGYDLGVGMLMISASPSEKDRMLASIGPFWDANETWLVLGVGLLLVAFPKAHGIILTHLYLPVALMLIGLIFRGVAFDFRAKSKVEHKETWNKAFFAGSMLASFSQGLMLGSYILGFKTGFGAAIFTIITGFCVMAGYCLIGSAWLVLKTDGALQRKAITWLKTSLFATIAAIMLISLMTPLQSERIFQRWFSWPYYDFLAVIPLTTAGLIFALYRLVSKMPLQNDRLCWLPFVMVVGIFVMCFIGMAYSFYPYIVPQGLLPDGLKIIDAASAPESLMIILVGALLVLPVLVGYTIFAYRIFNGKTTDLTYN